MRQNQRLIGLVVLAVLRTTIAQDVSSGDREQACTYDREAMLSLDQDAFDQDLGGGWRTLARNPDCMEEAANLIREYREVKSVSPRILFWHEGQLRATMGNVAAALALFKRSYRTGADAFGWNYYVDATIAFLRKDRQALLAAREALRSLPEPETRSWVDANGNEIEPPPWPPNLHVVDGFIECFELEYAEAYQCSQH